MRRRTFIGAAARDLAAALESLGRADLGGFEVTYAPGDRTGARFVDLVMVSSAAVVG